MKPSVLALLFALLGLAPAQAQSNFTMPPPAGVTVGGFQVVTSCGTGSLLTTQPAFGTIDITGKLCTNASGGGGGLSVVDQAPWVQGTSPFTPNGGVFNDTATLSSGQQGTQRLTTKRAAIVDTDTTGSALYSALTSAVPCLNATTATTNSYSNAQTNAANCDLHGNFYNQSLQSGNWYVGTYTLNTFVQPTITASSAYASGNVVGGLLTFTGAARSSGSTGMLTSVTIDFQDSQTGTWDLFLFDSNPASSTFTDKTAISINVADINKLIKVVHVADCTSGGTVSSCQADGIGKNYQLVTGTSMFGVLVTRNTPTFGTTNDAYIRIFGQEN